MTQLLNDFLSGSAAWGVLLTLAAFALGTLINKVTGKAIFNPLLLGSIFVIIFLSVCSIPYADYKASAAPVNYLLLPATVHYYVVVVSVAVAILLGAGYFGISAAAFCCGLLAVAAAWLVSRLSKADQAVSLILAGMMISSLFSAGTSFVKLVADTQQQLPAITYWLMGSLSSIKDKDVVFLAIPVALGMIPLFFLRWRMNLLTVGEEEAQSMGVNTRRLRGAVIVCATLLTSASVAVSGMIGWVGLVIPHFCRMLFGYDYRRLIPAGALFGAAFLLAVDDIARLVTTGELPLGILTAFVGAPLFLYLIATGGRRRVH